AEHPGTEIRYRNSDAHRALAGEAGDRHQAPHSLGDLVEARALLIGAVLAEAGNAAVNDARIDLPQRLVVDLQPVFDVRAIVFHHHVGRFYELVEDLASLVALQVQRDRALVAVQILEIETMARATQSLAASGHGRCLDLDDVRSPVRELAHAGRAGADAGEIENLVLRERKTTRRHC